MESIWGQWQIVAWVAPIAWATSSLIDVFLVGGRYYRNEIDGTVITALFGAAPCLVLVIACGGVERVDRETVLLALLAGASMALHFYAYFKALFTLNDAAQVDTTLNAYVAVVPILAFLYLDERLSVNHYAGITLASVGVAWVALRQPRESARWRTSGVLAIGVVSLSLSLVLADAVFQRCNFWTGTFWSTLGMLLGALAIWGLSGQRGVFAIARRHAGLFAVNEVIGGIAMVGTLRATDLSPSVSFIPVVECTSPIIILAMSLTGLMLLRLHPRGSGHHSYGALRAQLRTAPAKFAATGFILAGVYVINQPRPSAMLGLSQAVERLAEHLAMALWQSPLFTSLAEM